MPGLLRGSFAVPPPEEQRKRLPPLWPRPRSPCRGGRCNRCGGSSSTSGHFPHGRVSGANIAECAPITASYLWQARENGARIIVVDPRITPIARTCDLFLPVKPGRDVALFNGVLRLMIENGWIDRGFIDRFTTGFDAVAAHVAEWTPERTAEVAGVPERSIRRAAEWWGAARTSFLLHARGIEHSSHGVQNCLAAINLVLAAGRIGREGCGYATITGQGNGQGGREHGQKCDQLPGARDISNPEHRQ